MNNANLILKNIKITVGNQTARKAIDLPHQRHIALQKRVPSVAFANANSTS